MYIQVNVNVYTSEDKVYTSEC